MRLSEFATVGSSNSVGTVLKRLGQGALAYLGKTYDPNDVAVRKSLEADIFPRLGNLSYQEFMKQKYDSGQLVGQWPLALYANTKSGFTEQSVSESFTEFAFDFFIGKSYGSYLQPKEKQEMSSAIRNLPKPTSFAQVQALLNQLADVYVELYKKSKLTSSIDLETITQLADTINKLDPQTKQRVVNELRSVVNQYSAYQVMRGRLR